MQAFPVKLPSGVRYWTVLDDRLMVVSVADGFLRQVRLGRGQAELTTKAYAGAIALYLVWCQRTGRTWSDGAWHLGMFMTWLRHWSADRAGRGADAVVVAGPGGEPVRGEGRINAVLAAVRGFLAHAVTAGEAPAEVLAQLYELVQDCDLPAEVRGERSGLSVRLRTRHRLREPERPVQRASDEEIVAMLRACLSCRDRLMVLLLARAGLRRGELVGLRRQDIHFVVDASRLGCRVPGSHLHVVRRDNINRAWAKAPRERVVPVDFLVVRAHDQYVFERAGVAGVGGSDFVLVNLAREPVGAPMPPDAVNELVTALCRRAGLARRVTPHMLRHAYGSNLVDAGGAIDEVQELLGHASLSSTEIYVHPDEARLRAAVERVPNARLTAAVPR